MEDELKVIPNVNFYTKYVKRMLDITLCSIALIVLSPLFLIVSILELVFHGRPILYTTQRPGLNGNIIRIYKFRSMTNEHGEDGLLLPEEKRITRFGYYIRKFSIDELPELFCIIKGDMSIIGPRPLLVEYLDLYSPRHMMRHAVRPGLACPKVFKKGEQHLLLGTWREQFESDICYVEHVSFRYDIKVFIAVIQEIFAHDEYRASDTRVPFDGTNLDETRSKNEVENAVRYDSVTR